MSTVNIDGPRACTKHELPAVIELVDTAMREGADQTILTDYPLVYQDANLENIRSLKVDGNVVAVVPFIPHDVVIGPCQFTIGIISPTATAPDHRRRGYALQCLNSCLDKMAEDQVDLSALWTEIPTFRFYEHADYQAVRNQGWAYRCFRKDAELFADHGERIVPYDPRTRRYIEDIQRMHEQEAYGVRRSAEEYPALFSLPKFQTQLALRGDRLVAYLMCGSGVNKPGLTEAGGDTAGVETLLHHALSSLDEDTHLDACDNLSPTVLGDLLYERLPERRVPMSCGHMMIRINDTGRFMENISGYLERKNAGVERSFSLEVTETGETVSFEFAAGGLDLGTRPLESHLNLSRRELTSIVFGPHPERPAVIPEVLQDFFPIYFPVWVLDHS